mmetsp:Transcript_1114/g.1706  ORF Transcript_1114/g.1706 Transcript_1114/m.1706 type:complete len:105 (-) Transcript_1114:1004-1318(-)
MLHAGVRAVGAAEKTQVDQILMRKRTIHSLKLTLIQEKKFCTAAHEGNIQKTRMVKKTQPEKFDLKYSGRKSWCVWHLFWEKGLNYSTQTSTCRASISWRVSEG